MKEPIKGLERCKNRENTTPWMKDECIEQDQDFVQINLKVKHDFCRKGSSVVQDPTGVHMVMKQILSY